MYFLSFESRECVIGVSSASCWSWCTFLENLEERRTNAIPDICILTLRCEFFSRGSDFFRKVPTNHQHLWRWCQISGLTGVQCFVSLLSVQVLPTKQEVSDNSWSMAPVVTFTHVTLKELASTKNYYTIHLFHNAICRKFGSFRSVWMDNTTLEFRHIFKCNSKYICSFYYLKTRPPQLQVCWFWSWSKHKKAF